jgi:hypothetical protein
MVVQNDDPHFSDTRFLVVGSPVDRSGLVTAVGLSGGLAGQVTSIGWVDSDGLWVDWIVLDEGAP